jgi:hypothetical protein
MSRRPLLRPNWPFQRTVSDTVVKNLLPVDVFSHVFGHVFGLTWLLLLILGWHEAKNDGHPILQDNLLRWLIHHLCRPYEMKSFHSELPGKCSDTHISYSDEDRASYRKESPCG